MTSNWETYKYKTHTANISRSKGNQTIKFGQLIEYNTRKFFLKKSDKIWWINLSQILF